MILQYIERVILEITKGGQPWDLIIHFSARGASLKRGVINDMIDVPMDKQYNHLATEKKWQKFWGKEKPWTAKEDQSLPKLYVLDMFPYPSAEGLHVGHPEGYTASDIVARYLRMKGYNVLHPMGWDAFGLPAENFAIKTGINPKISTTKNIKNIKRQIQSLGFSYDWSREINTTNPEYYKWTQWIFLQMFKRGLAYEATVPINWCPSCKTGLANEEVVSGKCDRCGTAVVKKDMRQWLLRITKYADRLLEGLDKLDWPEPIKLLQRNWIGRSEGALVKFPITNIQYPIKSQLPNPKSQTNFKAQIPNPKQFIEVFTTRADTLFGATYLVLAPEHPLVAHSALARNASLNEASGSLVANRSEVEKYVRQAKSKSDLERTSLEKDKTGVELKGLSAINPATGKKIPIWVADYVLISYGTGAIMAVPAHDERDFEFAKKFNLPIEYVVAPHVVDSGNPPQSGKPTVERKTIQAIIYNPKTKSYLTLKWKEQSWRTFVVGGVEDDEDLAKAALREIREETGYIDLKLEGVMAGPVLAEYFASHKGENRRALATPILFSLKSEKCVTVSAEEKRRHEVEWWPIEKITGQTMRCVELPFWLARLRGEYVYTGEGVMINSEQYNGLPSVEGSKKITDWLEKKGLGKRSVNYKLRDWVFSRQRYWGEPIPLIHCLKCGVVPVPEDKLPVKLPEVKKYEPTGTGESPLAAIGSWVNVKCPKCGKPAKRETNTMPQWAGSCWYYLRYLDPDNENELVSAEKEKYWMGPSSAEDSDGKGGVDVYIGGAEHAVLHLLYARFWHMFLYDIGVVSTAEPFQTLKNQGIVLGEDGQKMSKSRGNVINPDNVIEEYGADSMRLYEMFMGPFEVVKPWSTQGLRGVYRFLQRVWSLREKVKEISVPEPVERLRHKLIKKITNDITTYNFNTAVSTFMETINTVAKQDAIPKIFWKTFLVLFSPFAPHLSEELWQLMGHEKSIGYERWPTYKEKLILEAEVEIIVQINGKLRDRIKAPLDSREEKIKKLALASGRVRKYLHRAPKKVIFVKDRLINFVI